MVTQGWGCRRVMDGRLLRATARLLSFALSSNLERRRGRLQKWAGSKRFIQHGVWNRNEGPRELLELPISLLNAWLTRLVHNEDLSWEKIRPLKPLASG